MFSLKIVDTDVFLDMSPSAQNLYFHLGMRADDDGFVSSPKRIMAMCNASEDDMRVLLAKNFIIKMPTNGVAVITHWHINNLIRTDRYQETEYLEEKRSLKKKAGKYLFDNVIPSDNQLPTIGIPRIGKDRIGKDRLEDSDDSSSPDIPIIIDLFKEVNPSYSRLFGNKTERQCVSRLLKTYGIDKLSEMVKSLPKIITQPYAPKITTPFEFEKNLGKLLAFISQQSSISNSKKPNVIL